jgi:hypothetical protein
VCVYRSRKAIRVWKGRGGETSSGRRTGGAARSLCVRLAADSSVEVEADWLRVSDLLHRLEEWITGWGLRSTQVSLDGRAYLLEGPVPPKPAGVEELRPSASPAA